MDGEPTQQLWFREVLLWEQRPQPWWEEVPALMPLYPLCHHGQRPRRAIEYATGVIEDRIVGEIERADTLTLLDIFGDMAYPRLDIGAIIGREKMKESRFGREMREQGRREGRREDILAALDVRFGSAVANDFKDVITAIDDLVQLDELHRLAIRCANPDEYRRNLPALTQGH